MASKDYTSITLPYFDRFTLWSTDVLQQIELPTFDCMCTVQFIANEGKMTHTGTDGGAIGSSYMTIPAAGGGWEFAHRPGDNALTAASIYVASATGSTVCEVSFTAMNDEQGD